jgi:hypothetical protein
MRSLREDETMGGHQPFIHRSLSHPQAKLAFVGGAEGGDLPISQAEAEQLRRSLVMGGLPPDQVRRLLDAYVVLARRVQAAEDDRVENEEA